MYLDQVLTEHLLPKWANELQMAQPFKSKDECRSALGPFSPNHPKDPAQEIRYCPYFWLPENWVHNYGPVGN